MMASSPSHRQINSVRDEPIRPPERELATDVGSPHDAEQLTSGVGCRLVSLVEAGRTDDEAGLRIPDDNVRVIARLEAAFLRLESREACRAFAHPTHDPFDAGPACARSRPNGRQ